MLLTKGRTVNPPEKNKTGLGFATFGHSGLITEEAEAHRRLHRVLEGTPPILPAKPETCAWRRPPRPSWPACCPAAC